MKKPIITLIGMSNVGKSYHAQRLEHSGYARICFDTLINKYTADAIGSSRTSFNESQTGAWLGLPYEKGYQAREALMLERERAAVSDIVTSVARIKEALGDHSRVVLDTQGSIIYAHDHDQTYLRDHSHIVHLAVDKEMITHMLERFIQHPKPVFWLDHYTPKGQESDHDALRACYPDLIAARNERYRQLAHHTIPSHIHQSPDFDITHYLHTYVV